MNNLPKTELTIIASSAVLIFLFLLWFAFNFIYFQNGQLSFGKIIARVGNSVLTEDDYARYYPVYNGQKQCASGKKLTSNRDEVIAELISVTKVQNQARDKGISVSEEEITTEKQDEALQEGGIEKLLSKCGWTDKDFSKAVEYKILKQKLNLT